MLYLPALIMGFSSTDEGSWSWESDISAGRVDWVTPRQSSGQQILTVNAIAFQSLQLLLLFLHTLLHIFSFSSLPIIISTAAATKKINMDWKKVIYCFASWS